MRRIAFPAVLALALVVLGYGCASGDDSADHGTEIEVVAPNPEHAALRAAEPAPPPTIPPTAGPSDPAALHTVDSLRITEDGAIVENVAVRGRIEIDANDVTVRNFRASGVEIAPEATGTLLEDGEIDGGGSTDRDGVGYANYTARRLDVHGVADGFKAHGNVVIEDCYVHDLAVIGEGDDMSHNDGVQISGGRDVIIRRSWFERIGTNAAIFVKTDIGEIQNVTIESNHIDGGGWSISVMPGPGGEADLPLGVLIRANQFGDDHEYGPMGIPKTGVTVASDNVDSRGTSLLAENNADE